MCGFAGFATQTGLVPKESLLPMTQAIAHRGPDDFGFYGWNATRGQRWRDETPSDAFRVGLGFRRLSILDLSPQGAQPMSTADGRYWLAFNGQIYNYKDLQAALSGVEWKSTSDTEVLLYTLASHGLQTFSRLNGMYAFAFFDSHTGDLVLARDPLGIKPLYYHVDKRGIFFGSEIRALLPVLGSKPSVRRELLARYLMNGWVPDPDTLFEGIQKVTPGHYLHVTRDGQVTEHRFWNFDHQPDASVGYKEWEDRLEATLNGALSRQMRSDVPLGFFLSGGVDSSWLTARAALTQKQRPTAYSIGFKWKDDQPPDGDMKASRLIGERFPIDRQEIILSPQLVDLMPKIVGILEEPIADAAALCSYLICQAAREKLTVLISGQGADEIFGGYPTYAAGKLAKVLASAPLKSTLTSTLPYSVFGKQVQSIHRLKKILDASAAPWPVSSLLLRSPFRLAQVEQLLSGLPDSQLSPYGKHLEWFEDAKTWDSYSQMMYLDTKTYLPSLNLAYSDKTSMANSVELRVPYLDQEVVSLAEQIPSKYKVTMREAKKVLKGVAARTLPEEVVYRRKAGFGPPLRDWFLKDLQPMAADLLSPARLRRQGLLHPELPSQWLEEHRTLKADHCMKLYTLMTLQLWIDQNV